MAKGAKKRDITSNDALNGKAASVFAWAGGYLHIVAFAASALIALSPEAAFAAIASTKHNFGSMSPYNIKTEQTSEICVFCHTPHNALPSTPMWNKQLPGDIYNVYASQTMVATLGQPTGSSKLCLSCHDGTIAIGSLLNLPGPGVPMAGTLAVVGPGVTAEGKISPTSAAYLGVDLTNDHPISFNYGLSYPSNTEIKAPASLPAAVKLDNTNKVQCTSCHDPHGTSFPKFMVTSVETGTLCTACHNQRYWATMPSVHKDSTITWNNTGVNPWHMDMATAGYADDTPSLQSCLACHRSHGGVAAKSLLKGTNPATMNMTDEEWTCLNCHNGNAASKNVDAAFNYAYKHDIKTYSGKHTPSRGVAGDPVRESRTSLGYTNTPNRHAECADCHNAHGAKSGNHAIGGANGNVIGANLLGGWGVMPTLPWPAAGTAVTSYTVVDFTTTLAGNNNLEAYMCIKCHSYYGYGTAQISVPSGNADNSTVYQADPTADFNLNNLSYHPIFSSGVNMPAANANSNWPDAVQGLTHTFRYVECPTLGTCTDYRNVSHTSTITCTDCHSSSTASDPRGAHGSNDKWILRRNETGAGTTANFCYNCHRRDVYGDQDYTTQPYANYSRVSHPVDGLGASSPFYCSACTASSKTGNNSNKFGILCLTCHGGAYDATNNIMQGVHGSNAAAGTLAGSQSLGKRMMNGACMESYTAPTTGAAGTMQFRTVNMPLDNDKVCRYNFTNTTTSSTANYNY